MRKRAWAAIGALILGGLLVLVGSGNTPGQQRPKMPPDFAFDVGEGSPGKVTFSHDQHFAKVPKCTECHTRIFKMKRGTTGKLTMAEMNAGKQCGTCHDGKRSFSVTEGENCMKCHHPG